MKSSALNPLKQKLRLRWLLLLFFFLLSIPVYFLLQMVYAQLEKEAYFSARHQTETLVDQIELNLQQLLKTEQNRSIAEYSFFNVMENPLLSESTGVKFSPLSEVPPKTDIKGIIGYFQINTDGSFHLPALPELGQDNFSGLSLAELESRIALKQKLRDLLSIKKNELPVVNSRLVDSGSEREAKLEKSSAYQPYIEEFSQQESSKIDEIAMDSIQVKEKPRSKKQSFKAREQYATRKELVQLPDQSMAGGVFQARSRCCQGHAGSTGVCYAIKSSAATE